MANFGYTSMKAAMQSGKRVGNWRNTPVYACDSKKLPMMDNDVFYIVFDDDNALVKDGKKYGSVTTQGDVRSSMHRFLMLVLRERRLATRMKLSKDMKR